MNTKSRVNWLEVDLTGLRKILERRPKEFIVYELIQNAWDEQSTLVQVSLPRPVNGRTRLTVWDNSPQGFRKLTDAFTLFAESGKKSNPLQRGIFNAGEKFVLACCEEASIITTTGGVRFDASGRQKTRRRRQQGSEFSGLLKLSMTDWEQICAAVRRLIPPVATTLNGEVIAEREPLHTIHATLPTLQAMNGGELRRTERKTQIRVYEPLFGETTTLYEMGIPVVETGDRWHVDVQQKVPLNIERDNVTPAYLRAVRVAVLNQLADQLTGDDAADTWVRDALGDERAKGQAVKAVINLRFGEKHVTFDPSDRDANLTATSRGYTVISPASLSWEEWSNVRRFGASLPAGRVAPSPKPFSRDGSPLTILDPTRITAQFRRFDRLARELAEVLIGRYITVQFADDRGWPFHGCYGDARLIVNVAAQGETWFEGSDGELLEKWIPFLIHEFAHDRVPGHLSEDYHRECCRLAGLLARAVFEQPKRFGLVCADR
jgi:hypothetical protein